MKIVDKVVGPAATLVALVIIYYVPILGGSVALSFVPLVWSAYTGGLVPAIVSAGIITAYTVLVYPPDYNRLAQVALSALIIAAMVGYLKRHAELSQSLNGNMKRLREAVELVRQLKVEWGDLPDSGKYKLVVEVESVLGNLATLVFGWHSIRMEQDNIKRELGVEGIYRDDGVRIASYTLPENHTPEMVHQVAESLAADVLREMGDKYGRTLELVARRDGD